MTKQIKVSKDCKCRYCHWYRPRKGHRCWGFTGGDVRDCIKNNYEHFRGRQVKVLRRAYGNDQAKKG